MHARFEAIRNSLPGLWLAVVVALAVAFISEHYGGPQFLLALLLGMAFNSIARNDRLAPGIDFASRTILRLGVMLLGVRITFEQIAEVGVWPVLLAVAGVAVAIAAGFLGAHFFGRGRAEAILSGGAVGVCGASAAMAISAVLPKGPQSERLTLLTVVGVTVLSTCAMIVYPVLSKLLGLSDTAAGIFFGSTIHDVAQVLGAGLTVSPQAGDVATLVKLVRVSCLLPVVVFAAWICRDVGVTSLAAGTASRPPALPGFLVGFVLLVLLGSLVHLPPVLVAGVSDFSRACLLVAIAALGVKTSFGELLALGWRPLALILVETLALLLFAVMGLLLLA